MTLHLDHVALLTADLDQALHATQELGAQVGPIESFPGEGTREVYLGGDAQGGRLLVMQPLGDVGPYARALAKRGPGLHHVAFVAPSLDDALQALGRAGWLLHPARLESLRSGSTAWLARPGVSTLLELTAGSAATAPALVTGVSVPVDGGLSRLLAPLPGVGCADDGVARLEIAGQAHSVRALLGLVDD